jgi:hypothetical protein
MKLDKIALSYAKSSEEAASILTESRREFIPLLHPDDLRKITKYIAACNNHNNKVLKVTIPLFRWYDHRIWPDPSAWPNSSGIIYSILVWVQSPKRVLKKNFTLSHPFDLVSNAALDRESINEIIRLRVEKIENAAASYKAAAEKLKNATTEAGSKAGVP